LHFELESAIAKEDIIRPLVLSFPDAPILGMLLKEKFPENLDYSARLISPTEMQVEFDVLNRGEKIVFNILSDKYPKIINGAIRAKNFSKLDIRDLQETSSYYEKIPSHVFYVTALSSLFLLFGISFAKKEFGPLRRDAYKISEALSPGFNKDQLKESLKKNIWDKLSEAQQALLEQHIHRTDPSDAEATQKLASTIRNEALNQDASGIIFIGALFSIIGLVYSFVRFILIVTA